MATQFKTPGVYINEPNSFPPSIVGVDTAVPAFIGYTQTALKNGGDVGMVPIRITSMADYAQTFGGPFPEIYYLTQGDIPPSDHDLGRVTLDGTNYYHLVEEGTARFYLYDCMRHFYANGGGECYVVSCGLYQTPASGSTPATTNALDPTAIINGLRAVEKLVGPTMLLVPDATLMSETQYGNVVDEMLLQCERQGDRVALLDIWGGDADSWDQGGSTDPVESFRQLVASQPDTLKYAMAYFPFLNTSVVQPTEVTIRNFDPAQQQTLVTALTAAVNMNYPPTNGTPNPRATSVINAFIDQIGHSVPTAPPTGSPPQTPAPITDQQLMNGLTANIPAFSQILTQIANARNILPPSPAMAGVFTTMDAVRGVWNAPANIGITQLVNPVVDISFEEQKDLNKPTSGLSVNAIRTFPARGTLVWGARTLAGNSNDWRYIQVRRTMVYVEQSIKTALSSFVFGPNTPSTWVTVVSMIESFLHGLWASGGLMGATADQAFKVNAGLGSTMTADDVLNGIMRVQVVLTMVHPAEFIELTFEQQMQSGS